MEKWGKLVRAQSKGEREVTGYEGVVTNPQRNVLGMALGVRLIPSSSCVVSQLTVTWGVLAYRSMLTDPWHPRAVIAEVQQSIPLRLGLS